MSAANFFNKLQDRRPKGRLSFWVSVVAGSMLLHVLGYMALQRYWMQSAKVQVTAAPVAVEFISGKRTAAGTQSQAIAVSPGRANKLKPTGTRPAKTNQGRSSTSQPRRSQQVEQAPLPAVTRPRSRPVEAPPTPIANKPLPKQPLKQPRPKPKPQPQPNQNQPPPATTDPGEPLDNQSPQPPQRDTTPPPPGGLDNPGNPDPADNPKTPPDDQQQPDQPNDGDQNNGELNDTPPGGGDLSPPGGAPAQVSLKNSYPGQDIKALAAKPLDTEKTVQIPYPPALNQIANIKLKAELIIDARGVFAGVACYGNGENRDCQATLYTINDQPISGVSQDTAESIAAKVFADWRFEPAKDGLDGAPLKSVQSVLRVEVQIQKL